MRNALLTSNKIWYLFYNEFCDSDEHNTSDEHKASDEHKPDETSEVLQFEYSFTPEKVKQIAQAQHLGGRLQRAASGE